MLFRSRAPPHLETQTHYDVYDPKVRQGPAEEQVPPTGPPDERLLQFPSTASSGRRLMRVSAGDSYAFFGSVVFLSIVQNTSANRNPSTSQSPGLFPKVTLYEMSCPATPHLQAVTARPAMSGGQPSGTASDAIDSDQS